jgi:S-DNA-T family DNA segregation ATPase FtsK/SpoIIIE
MATPKRKISPPAAGKTPARSRAIASEIAGVLLLFLAVYLLVSLAGFDAKDPSLFNAVAPGAHIHNYGGRLGAWLSDLALQTFGFPAFLLPFMIGTLGLRAVMTGERKRLFRKAGSFVLLLAILCPLLILFFQDIPWRGTKIPAGGLLGDLLSSLLNGILNSTGTLLFLLAAGAVYTAFATAISFRKIFAALGRMFTFAFQDVRIKVRERRRTAPEAAAPARKKPASAAAEAATREEEGEDEEDVEARAKSKSRPDPSPALSAATAPSARPRPSELKRSTVKPPEAKLPQDEEAPLLFPSSEDYDFPPYNLLDPGKPAEKIDKSELAQNKVLIEEKLREFDVDGEVKEYHPGPVITTYEYYPSPGVKISQVANLSEDLSLALSVESVRIQRIPGKSSLGVEIPNKKREIIKLRDILESEAFRSSPSKLTFALGKTVHDEVYVTDLAIMPHLLIAGATGTGKSVCLNALIASILYKATPREVKLILIDPKRLEFTLYEGIPHLLSPVINDSKKAGVVLMDAVRKMENRYHLLSQHKVRNIDQYNHLVAQLLADKKSKLTDEERAALKPLPYIVIIIDELAELMMVSAQDVDYAIARLAQLARAVGIHLVLATQRPSIDVITGTIKNNFSSRIAFRVPSKIDSRVILDTIGADKLLGMGDMLFMPPNYPRLIRLHCSYVSIPEVRRLVKFVKEQGEPEYDERLINVIKSPGGDLPWEDEDGEKDENYERAVELILHTGQASASYLQRKLKLGYARASRIIDQMEQDGILGPSEGSKPREILVDIKQYMDEKKKSAREDE